MRDKLTFYSALFANQKCALRTLDITLDITLDAGANLPMIDVDSSVKIVELFLV